MKNSSKNNFAGKNSKQYKKSSNFYSKKGNSQKENKQFLNNISKNQDSSTFKESGKKNKTFHP